MSRCLTLQTTRWTLSWPEAGEAGYGNRLARAKSGGVSRVASSTEKSRRLMARFPDYKALCESLGHPKLIVLSLPHGTVGDSVLEGLMPHLSSGDILLDCANENFRNTERRQKKCDGSGLHYLGVGVSGGYQAARAGPSLCPSGDLAGLEAVMPLLERVAAKDPSGKPCVGLIGSGGSGHFVKMMHNGIEHGMMSAICEAWGIMKHMGMELDDIADVLRDWNESGELVSSLWCITGQFLTHLQQGTFLLAISADICRTRSSDDSPVLSTLLDKVVQDVTGEEGTGVWSNVEAIDLHVAAPTLHAAHAFRVASAYRAERELASDLVNGEFAPQPLRLDDRAGFLENLRMATFGACLASFIQGLNVIAAADAIHQWHVNYPAIHQIWKAGCIIRSDYISNDLLQEAMVNFTGEHDPDVNLLHYAKTTSHIQAAAPALRNVVAKAVETDQPVPALSASLEYFKMVTGTNLPTAFHEAQLDYFGCHKFDTIGDTDVGAPTKGRHHFEWHPATSQRELGMDRRSEQSRTVEVRHSSRRLRWRRSTFRRLMKEQLYSLMYTRNMLVFGLWCSTYKNIRSRSWDEGYQAYPSFNSTQDCVPLIRLYSGRPAPRREPCAHSRLSLDVRLSSVSKLLPITSPAVFILSGYKARNGDAVVRVKLRDRVDGS